MVEDERPGVVGVDNCALVVKVVAPVAVAGVDLVAVVAAVVEALVVVVGGLAAVQVATGRLEQSH
jgi:hypothetical protein